MLRWIAKPAMRARSGSSVTVVPSTSGRSSRVNPASCAAINTTVKIAVATSPNSAQPAQSIAATGAVGVPKVVERQASRLRLSVVLSGEHVGLRLVPHGMVTGGFDVEAVLVHQRAAESGAERHQQSDDVRQH